MKIFLVILLVQVFHQQLVTAPPPPPPAVPVPADHFLMVIQWTKAFCLFNKKSKEQCQPNYDLEMEKKFYIHGLWPEGPKKDLVHPGLEYDLQVQNNLAKTDKRLIKNWPSAQSFGIGEGKGKGDEREAAKISFCFPFWGNEWKKHGTYQTMRQKDYFTFALDRYDAISVIHTDVVNRFHPRADATPVRVSDIVRYIVVNHHVTVGISCLKNQAGKPKLLYQIYFNMTLNGELMDMTTFNDHSCPENSDVLFL